MTMVVGTSRIGAAQTGETMTLVKDRYGNKLTKKQKAGAPQHWRLTSLLKRLYLRFSERDRDTPLFHVIVPDFGIVFRFNVLQPVDNFPGWDIVDVDLAKLEANDIEFGENLMWLLISKGYMAWLRDPETGRRQVFDNLIGRRGWGLKIIEKRLELYRNDGVPKHTFMIKHNLKLRDRSISYILTHYPDFFDYLW